ncbi:hypothetical protein ANO11243_051310 [Dothideomycetidae sp. 11243]|nr:hypothetical protein ANO11243_051310 [fungal sp. No.11243]
MTSTNPLDRKLILIGLLTGETNQTPLATTCCFRSSTHIGIAAACGTPLEKAKCEEALSLTGNLHHFMKRVNGSLMMDGAVYLELEKIAMRMLCNEHSFPSILRELTRRYFMAIWNAASRETNSHISDEVDLMQAARRRFDRSYLDRRRSSPLFANPHSEPLHVQSSIQQRLQAMADYIFEDDRASEASPQPLPQYSPPPIYSAVPPPGSSLQSDSTLDRLARQPSAVSTASRSMAPPPVLSSHSASGVGRVTQQQSVPSAVGRSMGPSPIPSMPTAPILHQSAEQQSVSSIAPIVPGRTQQQFELFTLGRSMGSPPTPSLVTAPTVDRMAQQQPARTTGLDFNRYFGRESTVHAVPILNLSAQQQSRPSTSSSLDRSIPQPSTPSTAGHPMAPSSDPSSQNARTTDQMFPTSGVYSAASDISRSAQQQSTPSTTGKLQSSQPVFTQTPQHPFAASLILPEFNSSSQTRSSSSHTQAGAAQNDGRNITPNNTSTNMSNASKTSVKLPEDERRTRQRNNDNAVRSYLRRWQHEKPFESTNVDIERLLRRIPWPCLRSLDVIPTEREAQVFFAHALEQESVDRRSFIRQERFKWHPDMIMYKFTNTSMSEQLRDTANMIFNALGAAKWHARIQNFSHPDSE